MLKFAVIFRTFETISTGYTPPKCKQDKTLLHKTSGEAKNIFLKAGYSFFPKAIILILCKYISSHMTSKKWKSSTKTIRNTAIVIFSHSI